MSNKIIRTICYFTSNPTNKIKEKLDSLSKLFESHGFVIQSTRICSINNGIKELEKKVNNDSITLGVGTLTYEEALKQFDDFISVRDVSFNIDLTNEEIDEKYVKLVFDIISKNSNKTFNFAYVFNNASSSPYFPSATYAKSGFAIGLQPMDLSDGCATTEERFLKIKEIWKEINFLLNNDKDFLGIDSSIAPIFDGKGSLVNFIKKVGFSFNESVLSDIYLKITKFIKEKNPKSVGLCGLMLPCLEDFELADEYEKGNFPIERNIFLSLHSGLGIDTYPIGIDEDREKVLNILKLVQGLSNKYNKPLSIRFVSDGKARIGEKTDFRNQYLKDVVIREL